MISVLGLNFREAQMRLVSLGYDVRKVVYVSKRGVENADSTRVIRSRQIGNNIIELTVSHFKTQI